MQDPKTTPMDVIVKTIDSISTKADFIDFLHLLLQDLKEDPASWTNSSVETYLEAAAAWTNDMEGYYQYRNIPVPQDVNWQVLANILVSAKMYE